VCRRNGREVADRRAQRQVPRIQNYADIVAVEMRLDEIRRDRDVIIQEDQERRRRGFGSGITGGRDARRRKIEHPHRKRCFAAPCEGDRAIAARVRGDDYFEPCRVARLLLQRFKRSGEQLAPVVRGNDDGRLREDAYHGVATPGRLRRDRSQANGPLTQPASSASTRSNGAAPV
jgi:hypothetical protein